MTVKLIIMNDIALSREQYRQRVQTVVDYITLNLSAPLELARLADISHFSPYHFHRIFSSMMTETPQDFINRLRLERAANNLEKAPGLSITEIALSCGFSSPSTFARSFKKHFGVSARDYIKSRNSNKESPTRKPTDTTSESLFSPGEIEVCFMPGLHLAYIANMQGYNLEKICQAWEKLSRWASAHQVIGPQTVAAGISFDDPLITPAAKCRYYACLSVPPEVKSDKKVNIIDIPAGRCAVYHITCNAEQIQAAYRYMYSSWLPDSGFQPADFPCFEIYHQTPEENSENKFVMDIYIPITLL